VAGQPREDVDNEIGWKCGNVNLLPQRGLGSALPKRDGGGEADGRKESNHDEAQNGRTRNNRVVFFEKKTGFFRGVAGGEKTEKGKGVFGVKSGGKRGNEENKKRGRGGKTLWANKKRGRGGGCWDFRETFEEKGGAIHGGKKKPARTGRKTGSFLHVGPSGEKKKGKELAETISSVPKPARPKPGGESKQEVSPHGQCLTSPNEGIGPEKG